MRTSRMWPWLGWKGIAFLVSAVFLAVSLAVPAEATAKGVPSLSSPDVQNISLEEDEGYTESSAQTEFRSVKMKTGRLKLSLMQYEEVNEEEAAKKQTLRPGELASSGIGAAAGPDAPLSMAASVEPGQFAFTTYGYGHGVGMSQNGANAYAAYGGYNYQQILFHYYPGTTLVQTELPSAISAGGRTGSVLDIISMIVYNEMSSTMHDEAMKAQAVAAYTYIMHPQGDTGSLICRDNPPANVVAAVQSVLGQALYFDGSYALTVYSASSGGYTASASDVYGGTNYPYLISVPCVFDAAYDPHYGTVTYLSSEEVRSRLQNAYGVALSGSAHSWISLNVGDGGYIRSAVIGGTKTVSGESLRSVLGLKSGRYTFVVG
ncbi:MAG: sporulation protein [Ruminococcus sp.]|nr:sporulation protein [Ruminococcus sp.]